MTTKTLLGKPRRSGLARPWDRSGGGIVAALFGLGLASLLASSEVQHAGVAVAAIPARAPVVAPPALQPEAQAAAPAHPTASPHRREIEIVASTVARRFRVSLEATRKLVSDAYEAGARSGVDPLLIVAVIAVESRFNPIAQSDGGAIGLMQVIPHYHEDKFDAASSSVLDPETNIRLGARVLKEYIKRGGTEVAGLQLYNGALADEDNSYANRVLAEKQRLQDALRREHSRA
jgi:soluble lytic murein transglycosylase-like protein